MGASFCHRLCRRRFEGGRAARIEPVITLSSGEAKQIEILYVEPFDGYRILFDWYPTTDSTDPVEMRLFLRCQGEAISETWLYQYFPPAADKRNYVDDRIMK